MEIRTCEEYVLAELERLSEENAGLREALEKATEEAAHHKEMYEEMIQIAGKHRWAKEEAEAKLEAVIRDLNESRRMSAPNFEPVREVPDGD